MEISKAELEGLILERTSELLGTSRQLREERQKRSHVELSLGQLREWQGILRELATELVVARDPGQVPQVLDRVLRQTSRFLGVEHACIVTRSDADRPMRLTQEWRGTGLDEAVHLEATVDLQALPWFADRLRTNPVATMDLDELPGEIARAEGLWLRRQGLQAVWALGLRREDRLIGYLGYLHHRKAHRWPVEYQDGFLTLGNLIALTLDRVDADRDARYQRSVCDITLRGLREGVLLIDVEETITMANEVALALLGRSKSEVLGFPLAEVLSISETDDGEPVQFPLRLIRRSGTATRQVPFRLMDSRKSVRAMLDLRSQSLVDSTGSRCGDVIFLHDLAGESGFDQERSIQGKLRSLGHLAAGLAHEISTPMQYIGDNTAFLRDVLRSVTAVREQYLDLINDHDTDSEGRLARKFRAADAELDIDFSLREAFTAIEQTMTGVEKVGTLVTAMKSLGRYSNRGRQRIDLNLAIRDVLTLTDHEWRYIARIDLLLQDDLPETEVEIEEVNQVLMEIIGNACDSIQRALTGGLITQGRITVRSLREQDEVCIEILDNGIGMTEIVRQRLFDPFFSTKELGSGSGQGMTMAREVIVNRHGGAIDVESEEGRGACIRIRLPLIEPQRIGGEEPPTLAGSA